MRCFIWLAKGFVVLSLATSLVGCSLVPKEAVELSNTVGRDLEEVHRAHRALAELHFNKIETDINVFIDETYRPAFIKEFAKEFKLQNVASAVLASSEPEKLLPVLTAFVQKATDRIESKRYELLDPIRSQRQQVLSDIDQAHRQIQAAQAIVTGHLASVRDVHETQSELFSELGIEELRTRIATTTANISDRVADLTEKGRDISAGADQAAETIAELDAKIDELKHSIGQ